MGILTQWMLLRAHEKQTASCEVCYCTLTHGHNVHR